MTVCVVSYNSSNTILETLDSIYCQDYDQIELIISDDGSTDQTVDICNEWILKKKTRFVHVEVISVSSNTGIPSNVNRGINKATGMYFKVIAGDDTLTPDCISYYVESFHKNPDKDILFSLVQEFRVIDGQVVQGKIWPEKTEEISAFNRMSAEEQFLNLLDKGSIIAAPTLFAKTNFLKKNNFKELYRCFDDFPMWISLTRSGIQLQIADRVTVNYRKSESLSGTQTVFYSRAYFQSRSLFFWNECYDYYQKYNLKEGYDNYRKVLLFNELVEALTGNRKNFKTKIIYQLIKVFINKFVKYKI